MNKKINPRKKPASQADVDKAYERGRKEGLDEAAAFFLSVLRDKEGMSPEDCHRIWQAIIKKAEAVNECYAKVKDYEQALLEEDGIWLCHKADLERVNNNGE